MRSPAGGGELPTGASLADMIVAAAAFAASRMTSMTKPGWDSMGTCDGSR
jgi:hypothetical protein